MNDEQKAQIVAKYKQLSQHDDADYSPLQCAAYAADREGVQVLLEEFKNNGALKQELSFADGKFGENILHIAIKDPVIFRICCKELHDLRLLAPMLLRPDGDGDTVMHQVVEFGRLESLKSLADHDGVQPLLLESMQIKNQHGETAAELAEKFEHSKTIKALVTDKVLSIEHLQVAKQNLPGIQEIFAELEQARSAPRM